MDLEGVVAKRATDTYGAETLWYVIRNPAYRQGDAGSTLPRAAEGGAPGRAIPRRPAQADSTTFSQSSCLWRNMS